MHVLVSVLPICLFGLLCAACPVLAQSQKACLEQARSELEKVYCEVKASRHGRALPALHDFRRNPPQTQILLLKRPAARLGLVLPKLKPSSRRKPASKPSTQSSPKKRGIKADARLSHSRLEGMCALQGKELICKGARYRLANNVSNKNLKSSALTAINRLVMPAYQGDLQDGAAVQRYLGSVYPLYLQKMLDIGLGASTMSFTKFFHTFIEVKRLEAPFAERMGSMYEHLKKDKQTIASQSRYGKPYPDDLSQCDAVGHRFIVCDDVKHNWVYVKTQ